MKKQLSLFLAGAAITLAACNNDPKTDDTSSSAPKTDTMQFSISEKPYGNFNNEAVTQYTLTNPSGMQVSVINYGGTVTDIITPDKQGNKANVVLSYNSLDGFVQKGNPYFNALIGRYGNRIANGKFKLDGREYTLAGNDHGNSLHGGNKGYDKVLWTASKPAGDSSLELTYNSKDGEEGYPGNLTVKVTYTLTAANELKIEYSATTDKATPLNLTNHCYFNLSGGKDSTVLGHELQILGDRFTEVNDNLIPTGKLPDVKGGPMDFTTSKTIGKDIQQVKGGYDHNWVLNKKEGSFEKIAIVKDNNSGRQMEVWTTEPGVQFYSGNFLDGTLADTRNGQKYVKHAGLCLETQHFPDSPNQPSFPSTILKPGETYKQTTVYAFGLIK